MRSPGARRQLRADTVPARPQFRIPPTVIRSLRPPSATPPQEAAPFARTRPTQRSAARHVMGRFVLSAEPLDVPAALFLHAVGGDVAPASGRELSASVT